MPLTTPAACASSRLSYTQLREKNHLSYFKRWRSLSCAKIPKKWTYQSCTMEIATCCPLYTPGHSAFESTTVQGAQSDFGVGHVVVVNPLYYQILLGKLVTNLISSSQHTFFCQRRLWSFNFNLFFRVAWKLLWTVLHWIKYRSSVRWAAHFWLTLRDRRDKRPTMSSFPSQANAIGDKAKCFAVFKIFLKSCFSCANMCIFDFFAYPVKAWV